MSSFNAEWDRAVTKSKKNIYKIIKESAGILFTDIIMGTPVDTGALRGSWVASLGSPDLNESFSLDKGGSRTAQAARMAIDYYKGEDNIYLSNSKPYADTIEYGHSSQAPIGMVRVNIIRFGSIVEQVARNNK